MKSQIKLAALAAFALGTATFASCNKGGDPETPVITITAQPAAETFVTEGRITEKLSVTASVTEGAALSYQWYGNTGNSNSGGTAVSGATAAVLPVPTALTEGTHYYFCEVKATGGATAKRSDVAAVTVEPLYNEFTVNGDTRTATGGAMYSWKGTFESSDNVAVDLKDADGNGVISMNLCVPTGNNSPVSGTYSVSDTFAPFTINEYNFFVMDESGALFIITGGTVKVSVEGAGDTAVYTITVNCTLESGTAKGMYRGTLTRSVPS